MTYSEKLRHPLWQKKRLEILNRDNWTCNNCRATEKNLQVHHIKYSFGRNPWDYPNDNFKTLCHECHEKEHSIVNLKESTESTFSVSSCALISKSKIGDFTKKALALLKEERLMFRNSSV